MRSRAVRSRRLRAGVIGASSIALLGGAAHAGIMIEFTGMNLVYDGSALYDAGSNAGGLADPADADPLLSVDFINNGVLVGSITSDVSLDVFIPDVVNIPDAPGTVFGQTTPGNPGFFDLLIGTSPLASQFLVVDLASVSVVYTDILGQVRFVFGAALAPAFAQSLPFGLTIDDPLTVSFSAQVDPGTLTSAGGFITGFTASGTGEYQGVPTPGAALVLGAGALGAMARRRRA